MNTLDLTLLSLYRVGGHEWPLLPGLLAQNPPKKSARGRERDRLLVYLTLVGNVSYSSSECGQIAGKVSESFYNTPGSLTFALKTAAESLNTFLVERNMKSTGKGLYSIGALVLCALRGNSMYIVQAGPTHVYQLGNETRHFFDSQLSGKGLGLSQTARMYFAQATINAGDRLLLCASLPVNWDKALSEEHGTVSLENFRSRLLAATDANVSAVLVQAADGSGVINIIQASKDLAAESAQPDVSAPQLSPTIQAAPAPGVMNPSPAAVSPSNAPIPDPVFIPHSVESSQPENKESQPPAAVVAQPVRPPVNQPLSIEIKPIIRERIRSPRERSLIRPETREQLQKAPRSAARFLAESIQKSRVLMEKLRVWVEKAIPRLLPADEEDQRSLPSARTWAIFFAIAIPVLVVTVAVVTYSRFGLNAQYETYYDHAFQAALQTLDETNPTTLRVQWQSTLDWLDKAEQYKSTTDSEKLRHDAQAALDNLDRTIRLDFSPAFSTPLSSNLQVSRMSASDTDIYMLEATRGAVLRGTFNSRNYTLDGGFQCGPGSYDGIQVGPLIDIIALPRSNPSTATVLGIDASGNLLYCIPDEAPKASFLPRPDTGWKTITAIAYDANNLYVLDAAARAVWVYFGDTSIVFPEKPYFFFESQVPVMLEQSIGMAINGDDLFLLHQDGHMTTCTLSRIDASPTRCNDPALYVDSRPGYESGIRLSDGVFSQITFTSPPDPSVALLEPYTQSIFRFSSRALELQNQVRAAAGKDNPLPKGVPVTAMAFSPNKVLFLFLNGQLFYAVNVP